MRKAIYAIIACLLFIQCSTKTPEEKYIDIQKKLSRGWNTWDTYSVLNHVLLPEGFGIALSLIDADDKRIERCQIGDRKEGVPKLFPGQHSFDGSYTEISAFWNGHSIKIESSASGVNNLIMVTPLEGHKKGMKIAVRPHNLWDRKNEISIDGSSFFVVSNNKDLHLTGKVSCKSCTSSNKEIVVSADKPFLIYCGNKSYSLEEARNILKKESEKLVRFKKKIAQNEYDCFDAMQSVLSWDNIYSPELDRVLTPVSRSWNTFKGGYIIFCWDAYFASMMLSYGNRELAYANIVEITNTVTPQGFIPNRMQAEGNKYSYDHSQPPVGSLSAWNLYKRYGDKWLLELLYDRLLSWNRWWNSDREWNGLLCWGSNPYEPKHEEWYEIGSNQAAKLESGLDNTHMYDNVEFDRERHLLCLQDVGLTSLYVMDCEYLALIAEELGHTDNAHELQERAELYRKNLQITWDEEDGMFYNRDPRTGQFNKRYSPTNLYIMLAKAATPRQAERIIREHMLNPERLGGPWLITSTPRNDVEFKKNHYWKGRIWAPMNFLVYWGMRNYSHLAQERLTLVEMSKKLLMKSWLSEGYIFENYNATTGQGDDTGRSDKFYHWGALLGFISLIENDICINH